MVNKNRAFTLIELLVVVAIIGILAAVGVVAYNGYTKSAKIKATVQNHSTVVNSVQAILTLCETQGTVSYINKNGITTKPKESITGLIEGWIKIIMF